MPRKASQRDDLGEVDFTPFYEGITLLKFGRAGQPHEKIFTLTRDNRFIVWLGAAMSWKFGRECEVDLERVKRVQLGQSTVPFSLQEKVYGIAHERSISIIYSNEDGVETSLDLLSPNDFVLKYINRCIRKAVSNIEYDKKHISKEKRFLKAKWEAADSDRSGLLNRREVISIVSSMNINKTRAGIIDIFNSVDVDASGQLDFPEFLNFMERLRRRPDLEVIWGSLVSGHMMDSKISQLNISSDSINEITPSPCVNEKINDEKFQKFWHLIQGEDISIEEARAMIARQNDVEEGKKPTRAQETQLGYYEWRNLITSGFNDVYSPEMTEQYQDMTRPLSDYYMASSHNTYLEGDQLASKSSVNRYIDDLTSGCRCVELDCWDGDHGEPIIYHGHTLTGKIKFKDVVKAIKKHGFTTSPYPVILSIENHCSLKQQVKMTEILKSILKESLAIPIQNVGATLPSPQDLMSKVLIKGKRVKTHGIEHEEDEEEEEDHEHGDSKVESKSKKAPKKAEKETDTDPSLSAITYLATGKVKAFTPEVSNSIPADYMASYSEGKTEKTVKKYDQLQGWINHNRVHMSRIYPKGTRIDSSNYDPCPAWAAGNQMVALNYQTPDLSKHINMGKFRQNGNCGYVLKPPSMLYTPPGLGAPPATFPIRVTIHIISGQQLPKAGGRKSGEIIDPFVTIAIHGVHDDTKSFNTKVIDNNGFNPIWDEIFHFSITNPDSAHLVFTVNDQSFGEIHEFIAFSSIPINCLRPGLRSVGLFDKKGQQNGDFQYASLLIRTEIEGI